jgi:hypothetical protein
VSGKQAKRRRADADADADADATPRSRRRWIAGAAAAVVVVGAAAVVIVASGGSEPGSSRAATPARPVTAQEADRLALTRFQNYRATGAHFRTRVSSPEGALAVEGDVDYRMQLGYARVSGAGDAFFLQWSDSTLLAWPAKPTVSVSPGKLPAGKPVGRALAPAKSAVDSVLAVVLGLGSDRPDNAQLIRRNGARWLRSATLAGTKVDVLQGPAATGQPAGSGAIVRYWVDATGHLLRLDAFLAGGSSATRIDFDAKAFTKFPRSPKLAPRA